MTSGQQRNGRMCGVDAGTARNELCLQGIGRESDS